MNLKEEIRKEMRTFKKVCIGVVIICWALLYAFDRFYMIDLVVSFGK